VSRTYGGWIAAAISIICAACTNPHVNGTRVAPDQPCEGNWTAVVTNGTDRVYDLYVGKRLVGTSDPHTTTRTIIEPELGRVTPVLVQSPTTRDLKGPYIGAGALRMVCE
jgi:hypothetical protein